MDDTFQKYNKIKQLGDEENKDIFLDPNDEIVIEEKIDGANFRFIVLDGKLVFGSHNLVIEDENQKNWKRCIDFVKQKYAEKKFLEGYIYFGECILKHSMEYDWKSMPPILGFDILDKNTNKYLASKKEIFESMGILMVPLIKTCFAGKIGNIDDSMVPESAYAPISATDRKAEGLIFKNYKKQIFAKYVRARFKEINRKAFGGGKKYANNDDELIIATYCTNPRIDKYIFKLMDEGMALNKVMMTKLPVMVYQDIIEENWRGILNSRYQLDLQEVKRLVAKRCLAVLDQVITNNQMSSESGGKEMAER